MSNRYAPLPNPRSGRDANEEMEAAFGGDDSGDEDDAHYTESHPLNPHSTSPTSATGPVFHSATPRTPGTYDFENVDYDYPPPGSPPSPSSFARPNDYGNSNGQVPDFSLDGVSQPRRGWLRRTAAAVIPAPLARRLGVAHNAPSGAVGGGGMNDGVFANVTAKPTPPRTVQDGDDTYVMPEDARAEAPPSYASAQADAVPPYWETTIHAPFAPDSLGEMIIDNLPTGSLFSFLWNMLVSISFQFVGFLLTYLLHTSHAARFGSRAGLGVTLIQYGFALRGRLESNTLEGSDSTSSWWGARPPMPSSDVPVPGAPTPIPTPTPEEQAASMMADAPTEWLSFFLMTVGWFVLLTSLLGFLRVKRWERGILASQRENSPPQDAASSNLSVFAQFERAFHFPGVNREIFRQGFTFGRSDDPEVVATLQARHAEEGIVREHEANNEDSAGEHDPMMRIDLENVDRETLVRSAIERDRRLQDDLREAGLI